MHFSTLDINGYKLNTNWEIVWGFSWEAFHIYVSKVYIYKKKYSAKKIKAHSLLKITQTSNQPVINNASF